MKISDSFFWGLYLWTVAEDAAWIEAERRKEVFKKIYSWLKDKSERLRIEDHKAPKIITDLSSDWCLKHVEISTIVVEYGSHMGKIKRLFLRISGVGGESQHVDLALKARNPFDEGKLGSEFSEDIKSGDPMFDFWHIIRSETPETAIKLVKDQEFRDYIRNIVDLRIFEVKGNKNLKFTVECSLDFKSAINAILAMERVFKILKL